MVCADTGALPDNRSDETRPYRDPQSRCPSASEMMALGAAR